MWRFELRSIPATSQTCQNNNNTDIISDKQQFSTRFYQQLHTCAVPRREFGIMGRGMHHDQLDNESQHDFEQDRHVPVQYNYLLTRLRAYLMTMPDVRLAYFQPGPDENELCLSGPDHARVVIAFTRNISSAMVAKRLLKVRRHFTPILPDEVEFLDIERLGYREACEVAFNERPIYGSTEAVERDRLYRYSIFLEWNAGKRMHGEKQETPPALAGALLEHPARVASIPQFIVPIYRHLKMIEEHLREMRRLSGMELPEFTGEQTNRTLAESYLLKSIQSAILITMSVVDRKMRLTARDYRDLFLLLPVYGLTSRERAQRLVKCAELRDRLIFQSDEPTAVEIYEHLFSAIETLHDFKLYMLNWLFEHCYGPSGELLQSE